MMQSLRSPAGAWVYFKEVSISLSAFSISTLQPSEPWITATRGIGEWGEWTFKGGIKEAPVFWLLSYVRRGIHSCSHLQWRLQSDVWFSFLLSVLIVDMACHLLLPEGGGGGGGCWYKAANDWSKVACSGKETLWAWESSYDSTGVTEHHLFVLFFKILKHTSPPPVCFSTDLCIDR